MVQSNVHLSLVKRSIPSITVWAVITSNAANGQSKIKMSLELRVARWHGFRVARNDLTIDTFYDKWAKT